MAANDFPSDTSSDSTPRSRFASFTSDEDEPQEGGVHSVSPSAPSRKSGNNAHAPAPGSRTSAVGVPGPQEKLLDISELARTTGMHYTHKFSFPPGKQDEDLENVTPIIGQITLTNTGAILLLQGHVETTLRLEDSRTLEPLDQFVETELEEEFELVGKANAFKQDEVVAVDEDTPAAVVENNVLNVVELLRQNLLLAAPLQPVRDEDEIPLGAFVYIDPASVQAEETGKETAADDSSNPLRRLGELLQAKNGE